MKNGLKIFLQRNCFFLFAKFLLFGIFLFVQVSAQAQDRTISGTVTGVTNEPIFGATVTVQGTILGVLTDLNGRFSLSVPPTAKTLIVSFVGYDSKEIAIGSSNVYNLVLTESLVGLEEVVVVGYGTQKKISVTGSIVSVSSADLIKSPNASVSNSLAGRVTGLVSVQYSGRPGASDPEIYVRGIGSLSSSSSTPLMLVDGVEREFSQLDPNEIESISILKDASATAVYGIRGANGVIIVTTKRGVEGAPKISFSTSTGLQAPTYLVDMADSYTYALSYNQAQMNDNPNILPSQLKFSPLAIKSFKDGSQPLVFPDQDWADMLIKPTAFQNQQNINISGGSKVINYFVSLGSLMQDGLFKTFKSTDSYSFKYWRYNYRANIDVNITETTTLSLTMGGRSEIRQQPGTGGSFTELYYAVPYSGTLYEGKRILIGTNYIPSTEKNNKDGLGAMGWSSGYQRNLSNVMNLDIGVAQKMDFITKGLSWRMKVSNNNTVGQNKTRSTSQPTYDPFFRCTLDPTAPGDSSIIFRKTGTKGLLDYSESSLKSRNWYLETALAYSRRFGSHSVTGLLLYNASKRMYPGGTYNDIPRGYVGMAARATYDYRSKYLLDLNLGYNGSENFAPDKRFGFFPAASAGWVLTEEKFLKNKVNFLNFLKLRVSYGVVGNDQQGNNRFLYMPDSYILSYSSITSPGMSFGTTSSLLLPMAKEGKIGNAGVTWEKAKKQNYGIDIRIFNGLSISADYFYELRNNILTTQNTLPGIFAMTLPAVNIGRVQNQGYEVEVRWRSKPGRQFVYNIGGNISFATNKILFMDEVPPREPYLARTGQSVEARFGFVFDGFWTEEELTRLADYPDPRFSVKPGDVRFKDLNNDNVIDDYDQKVIGFPNYPEYNFSMSGGIEYKGFDLSMLWNGVSNCSRELSGGWRYNFGVTYDRGLLQWMADNAWTPETAATAIWPRLSLASANYNGKTCSLYLRDATYLRLKNLELGYSFNIPALKRLGISRMRVSASGYDLLTFSKLKIIDPEQSGSSMDYPLIKIYNLGLNVTF
jgi:TonB-linked SusC/RagA family outer membrane protein